MADRATPALGLSIGSTNLAAVTADVAIIRKPVLTLYRQRPPEVGVPSENPKLDEPGVVVTDFVDRVGDPAGIVAADGSVHRSDALLADGLRALAYAASGGRPLPDSVAVSYPAHWSARSVGALGAALAGVAEWSDRARRPTLIPDAAAALAAVRTNPGINARGTVAVCDFGGSGTSITLMDAAGDEPLAPTVRHHDFCGDMIDQALLTAAVANMPSTGAFASGTSAIGPLSRLRSGCRAAKERLSSNTVATLSDVRLTRDELDDAIRGPLTNLLAMLDDALRRNGIRDLVAVVSVGGGANIPAVTTRLSGHLRVPVVTTPRPQLAAATGAALRATRRPDDNGPTAQAPAATATAAAAAPVSGGMPARAWADDGAGSSAMPTAARAWPKPAAAGQTAGGPALKVAQPEPAGPEPKKSAIPWRRLPMILVLGALAVVVLAGVALAIGLGSKSQPLTNPGGSSTPASPAPPTSTTSSPPPPATQEPPPSSPDTNAPPAPDTPTPAAPPATQNAPAAPAPSPARAQPATPPILRIPEIPPLPPIPGLNAPIPGFPEIPTLISQIAPRVH